MQAFIDSRYTQFDVVHKFINRTGDRIDCIPREKQPAIRRLVAEGRPVPPAPEKPPGLRSLFFDDEEDVEGHIRRCPVGTVAFTELTMDTLRNFDTLDAYLRAGKDYYGERSGPPVPAGVSGGRPPIARPAARPIQTHDYAYGYQNVNNQGAGAILNVWKPAVSEVNEESISQIWVTRGTGGPMSDNLQSVEAGLQVLRSKWGDWNLHIFVFHTPDDYTTVCYNNDCSNLVIESGSCFACTVSPTSVYNSTQYIVGVFWQRETNGDWTFYFDSEHWGTLPAATFDAAGLGPGGNAVLYGGEITDDYYPVYTHTDMGSGSYASEGLYKAAYQSNLVYRSNATPPVTTAAAPTYVHTTPNCYTVASWATPPGSYGTTFFFGGPGNIGDWMANTCYYD